MDQSNTSVATVDSRATSLPAREKGYSIITAAATDGSGKYAECVVLSKPKIYVTGITINYGTSLDILVNDSTYLKARSCRKRFDPSRHLVFLELQHRQHRLGGLLKGVALGEATITATPTTRSWPSRSTSPTPSITTGGGELPAQVNVRASASG